MNTVSMRLRYRPLKLGWCVSAGDMVAFRQAIRSNFTFWGGRFNPIIPVDDRELADALIRLYRVDALVPTSTSTEVTAFIETYNYLPWPFFGDQLFTEKMDGKKGSLLVDISHPITKLYNNFYKNNPNPEMGLDLYEWDENDPLSDTFLCSYGALLECEMTGTDYVGMARQNLLGQRNIIANGQVIQVPTIGRESLSSLNVAYLKTHYAIKSDWDHDGFYIGESNNFEDLVNFWNLRASGVGLMFFDPRYAERLNAKVKFISDHIRASPAGPLGPKKPGLWHRRERSIEREQIFFGEGLSICSIDKWLWSGSNVRSPIMYFDESPVLASIVESTGSFSTTFSLSAKPFVEDYGTQSQHYVLSVDPGIGLYMNERATFHAPFIPELNEFYGRNIHFSLNETRAEPEGIGIVTSTFTDSMSLNALDVTQLIEEIFRNVGIEASVNKAGLLAKTLIRQMGGLNGCRVFRIAGVRTLIENHKPDQSFDRGCANQTVLGKDTPHPLSDYRRLYIGPRKAGSELKGNDIVSYLLEKGVFRAGLNFSCPSCQLDFWRSLDDAKSRLECEYCGHSFNTTPQIKDKAWAFRRSGLFGRDDHQEGAIPVLLTLQQLMRPHRASESIFTTATTLRSKGTTKIKPCETDFIIVSQRPITHRIEIVIGECKTRQPITKDDVDKLTVVADAFPPDRYDVYIVFARLTAFTDEEIEIIKPVNGQYQKRVILLTDRELEPHFMYERAAEEFEVKPTAASFADMANSTSRIFFEKLRRSDKTSDAV